jgi:hypothetical protein
MIGEEVLNPAPLAVCVIGRIERGTYSSETEFSTLFRTLSGKAFKAERGPRHGLFQAQGIGACKFPSMVSSSKLTMAFFFVSRGLTSRLVCDLDESCSLANVRRGMMNRASITDAASTDLRQDFTELRGAMASRCKRTRFRHILSARAAWRP